MSGVSVTFRDTFKFPILSHIHSLGSCILSMLYQWGTKTATLVTEMMRTWHIITSIKFQ